jgi:hypothetical protein
MKITCWIIGLLLFSLIGCAGSPYGARLTVFEDVPLDEKRYPPHWYDNDPTMRHWYTMPYYNPYQQ